VAGTVALQATADSSTATPFRNDKHAVICSEFCWGGTYRLVQTPGLEDVRSAFSPRISRRTSMPSKRVPLIFESSSRA
jgi:hypothetical protein